MITMNSARPIVRMLRTMWLENRLTVERVAALIAAMRINADEAEFIMGA